MCLAICWEARSEVGAPFRSGSCTITGSMTIPSFQTSRKTNTTTRQTPMVTATEIVTLRITSSHREKPSNIEKAVGLGLGSGESEGASVGIGAPARTRRRNLRAAIGSAATHLRRMSWRLLERFGGQPCLCRIKRPPSYQSSRRRPSAMASFAPGGTKKLPAAQWIVPSGSRRGAVQRSDSVARGSRSAALQATATAFSSRRRRGSSTCAW